MATETFTHRTSTSATWETVWAALQRPETWARIGGVDQVRNARFGETGDLVGFDFSVTAAGRDYQGRARRAHFDPFRQVALEIDSQMLEGRIVADIEPIETGSAVRMTMTMSPKGFIASMLFPVVTASVGGGFVKTVEDFVTSLDGHARP